MKYFLFLLKHKWYVFLAGILYTRANLFDLIVHDWNKFLPEQFKYYRNKHHKLSVNNDDILKAWLYHQNYNKHHWEFWIARTGHGNEGLHDKDILVEIPERYVRELVADWFGAHRTYGTSTDWPDVTDWDWMRKYGAAKMRNRIHPKSIKLIDKVFEEIAFKKYTVKCQKHTHLFTDYLKNYEE